MVLFFDIDGTLVDDKTRILPSSTAQAIEKLRQNGHIPIVNTGRPYSHIDPRVRALPFAGCICAGGGEVRLGEAWLKRDIIAPSVMEFLVERVRRHGLQVLYEAEGGYYLDGKCPGTHPEIEKQCAFLKEMGNFVRDVSEGITAPVIKFCTFDMPECDRGALVAETAAYFDCIDRRGMAEFVGKGNSKAGGMALILSALNCPAAETFAFGDSGNDIPMLRFAGTGVAMGNAVEEAKNAADFVTKSVLEDGIAYALRHFDLI